MADQDKTDPVPRKGESAPAVADLRPGQKILISARILDVFEDSAALGPEFCRVNVQITGSGYIQKFWVPRSQIRNAA